MTPLAHHSSTRGTVENLPKGCQPLFVGAGIATPPVKGYLGLLPPQGHFRKALARSDPSGATVQAPHLRANPARLQLYAQPESAGLPQRRDYPGAAQKETKNPTSGFPRPDAADSPQPSAYRLLRLPQPLRSRSDASLHQTIWPPFMERARLQGTPLPSTTPSRETRRFGTRPQGKDINHAPRRQSLISGAPIQDFCSGQTRSTKPV